MDRGNFVIREVCEIWNSSWPLHEGLSDRAQERNVQGRSHSTQQDTEPQGSATSLLQAQSLRAVWGGRDPEGTLKGPSATPATVRDISTTAPLTDGSKHRPTWP